MVKVEWLRVSPFHRKRFESKEVLVLLGAVLLGFKSNFRAIFRS